MSDAEKNLPLSDVERDVYTWQMWTPGFGERGQQALKNASVLITRTGGVGGAAAYELAAAGIGRLVLAHAGNVRPNDLNRQLLMTHDWIGKPRVESAARRLRELNPRLEVEAVAENISEQNAERLVAGVDLVVDCAPLFRERYLLNRECVRRKIPLIECAMYEFEAQITSLLPGKTPCLACLYPNDPPAWKREFPVFGAVAGMAGCIGATEAIKIISGVGEPLYGRMLLCNLREMKFRTASMQRNPDCAVCNGEIPTA
ncbi:MAG TPA: HesA/MoeB/ThiF family protein [Planctomycetota bacterium]|nr:HesA/MoeB/ThiF family protein [Planctomycetota bacterium]